MRIRTYTRTIVNDIFKNNFFVKILTRLVNFYYDLWFKPTNAIKFQKNNPIDIMEKKSNLFFQSVTGDKIDCK